MSGDIEFARRAIDPGLFAGCALLEEARPAVPIRRERSAAPAELEAH